MSRSGRGGGARAPWRRPPRRPPAASSGGGSPASAALAALPIDSRSGVSLPTSRPSAPSSAISASSAMRAWSAASRGRSASRSPRARSASSSPASSLSRPPSSAARRSCGASCSRRRRGLRLPCGQLVGLRVAAVGDLLAGAVADPDRQRQVGADVARVGIERRGAVRAQQAFSDAHGAVDLAVRAARRRSCTFASQRSAFACESKGEGAISVARTVGTGSASADLDGAGAAAPDQPPLRRSERPEHDRPAPGSSSGAVRVR